MTSPEQDTGQRQIAEREAPNTLTTATPAAIGAYEITGYRAWDATMRFDVVLDCVDREVLLENAPWPVAYKLLASRLMDVKQAESVLRSVCPVQHNDGHDAYCEATSSEAFPGYGPCQCAARIDGPGSAS